MTITQRPRRSRLSRRLAWLGVATMSAMAVVAPSAAPALALTGAIYTSNFDGSIINENVGYAARTDVYLTGGPCSGGSHLANDDYYFQVTSPDGVLLSSDAIGQRLITVANGFIQSSSGHVTNALHCDPAVVGITVQLFPFDDTPNPGGEYKLTVATTASVQACPAFSAASNTYEICTAADQKSDNFKVGEVAATPTPTPTPRPTPTPTAVVTPDPTVTPRPTAIPNPEPTPTGGVGGATGTPAVTLPPTSTFGDDSRGGTDGGWRIAVLTIAALLAATLLLAPASAVITRGRPR